MTAPAGRQPRNLRRQGQLTGLRDTSSQNASHKGNASNDSDATLNLNVWIRAHGKHHRTRQGSVRLGAVFVWDASQAGCRRVGCDSSGVWPLRVCLGNELSARARRRRSGARFWLDQELVRPSGVTLYRPAVAVCLASDRHHRTHQTDSEDRSDACRRAGLRARRRHPPRRARHGCRYCAGRCCCGKEGHRRGRSRLSGSAPLRRAGGGGPAGLGDRGHGQLRGRAGPLFERAGRSRARDQPHAARGAAAGRQGRLPGRGPDGAGGAGKRNARAAALGRTARSAAAAADRPSQRRRRPPRSTGAVAQRDRYRTGVPPRRAAQAAAGTATRPLQPPPPHHGREPTSSPSGSSCAASPAASARPATKPTSSSARSSPTCAHLRPRCSTSPASDRSSPPN